MNTSLRGLEIGAGIHRLRYVADTGADGDARCAVACDRDGGQRAVALGADAKVLPRAGPVARVHLLFLAVKNNAHRRLSLARQGDCDAAVIAERRF